jgi:hypothetical protein
MRKNVARATRKACSCAISATRQATEIAPSNLRFNEVLPGILQISLKGEPFSWVEYELVFQIR